MNKVQNKPVKNKIIRKTRYTEIVCRYDKDIDDDEWDNNYQFQEYNDEDDYQDDCASVYAECGECYNRYHRATNAFDCDRVEYDCGEKGNGGFYWSEPSEFSTYKEYSDYIDHGEDLADMREMQSRGM
jgi:hypothetical protein